MAGYTYDGVADLLGPVAHAALGRNQTVPGLRRTGGVEAAACRPEAGPGVAATRASEGPLATLTRLFLLQAPVDRACAEAALPGLVGPLAEAGVLRLHGARVTASLDIRPYAVDHGDAQDDLWVVSDLTPGMDGREPEVSADHVLGVSGASTSLAQLAVRRPVARALDLGAVELREGSLFEPVAGERFDLIVSNPPFVISPARSPRLVYRDSGLPGDAVVGVRRLVGACDGELTVGAILDAVSDLLGRDLTATRRACSRWWRSWCGRGTCSVRQRRDDVGVPEVVPHEQQRLASCRRQRVGETVPEVQPGG